MSEAVIPVRMSDPLLGYASQQAQRNGVSLETWLLSVAAERIRDEQVAERFFRSVPRETAAHNLGELLDRSGNNPPEPGDELPEGYVPFSKR
jgi:hypothetical protein